VGGGGEGGGEREREQGKGTFSFEFHKSKWKGGEGVSYPVPACDWKFSEKVNFEQEIEKAKVMGATALILSADDSLARFARLVKPHVFQVPLLSCTK